MLLSLVCYVLGDDPNSVFRVKIDSSEIISDLKDAIKVKKSPTFNDAPADMLRLWKVSIPYGEIFKKGIDAKKYQDDGFLLPLDKLSEVFSGDPAGGCVHIVVKPPPDLSTHGLEERPLKRRKIDDQLEDIPPKLLDLHNKFWGVPLDSNITTLPDLLIPELDKECGDEGEASGDILQCEAFLDASPRLLVRAEYIRVFEAVENLHKDFSRNRLAVVTGQPGIGKTHWVFYALCRCLGEKQPVVWYQKRKCFYFSEMGVRIIDPEFHKSVGKHTWCFVDSRDAPITLPNWICNNDIDLFPIYVTSPKKSRWRKLEQQGRIPTVIIMNPWTVEELKKALPLYPGHDAATIQERFHNAGPTPRICFEYTPGDIQELYAQRAQLIAKITSAKSFADLVEDENTLGMDDLPHRISLIRRLKRNDMQEYTVIAITDTVHNQLRQQFLRLDRQDLVDTIRRFFRVPSEESAVGSMFEALAQRDLPRNVELVAKPMFQTNNPRSLWHAIFSDFTSQPRLQKAQKAQKHAIMSRTISLKVIPKKTIVYSHNRAYKKKITLEEDVYYKPKAGNEVGIDAFILHDQYLYLLQYTGGREHGIKDSLKDLLLRYDLPDRSNWRFIFVVPETLSIFACPHSGDGILKDHTPYTAKISVK